MKIRSTLVRDFRTSFRKITRSASSTMYSTRNRILATFPGSKFPQNKASECREPAWIPTQDSILYKAHLNDCQYEVHTLDRTNARVSKRNVTPVILSTTTSQLKSRFYPEPVESTLIETSIPSLTVETITNDSEQTEHSPATPSMKFRAIAPKPVNVQLPSNTNESNSSTNTNNANRGGSGTCYVCNNKSGNGIRMFTFPSDPNRLALWASVCNLDLNRVFPGDFICSLHFKPEDIKDGTKEGKRCGLKRTAVPIPVNEIMVAHHHDYIIPSPEGVEVDADANVDRLDTPNAAIEDIPCAIQVDKATQTEDTTSQKIVTHVSNRRYIGDFKISDMDHPAIAKLFYEMAMKEIKKNRHAVGRLQKKVRRCEVVHKGKPMKKKLREEMKVKKEPDYEIVTVTS